MALVTNAGEEYAVDKLMDKTGSITTRPEFVAWGTSSTAEAETQTTLVAESAEARVSGTVSKVGTGDAAVMRVVATLTSGSAQTIREVGLFTALTVGTMFMRHVHSDTVLANGEGIQYTIEINPE
jgi:hypothetical protein